MNKWTRYYDAVGDDPRDTLLQALRGFAAPGVAVDLGCGTGRDTLELLRRGWEVLAIDFQEEAIDRLRGKVADETRLRTQIARFEDAALPACDLVSASWSLPFCRPERFEQVWQRIVDALRAEGRFCGHLFGERDGWANESDMTFQSRPQAEALFGAFDLERFDEIEEDSQTVVGDPKHWHVFHVVARKR